MNSVDIAQDPSNNDGVEKPPLLRMLRKFSVRRFLVFIAIIFFLSLSAALVRTKTLLGIKASEMVDPLTCVAYDVTTLSECVQKVNSSLADTINIKTLITCTDPQIPCGISLKSSSPSRLRTIKIFGSSPESGIKRTYDPGPTHLNTDNYLVKISGASDALLSVSISNLSFEDSLDSCATPDLCANLISSSGVGSISIEKVHIKRAINRGVDISGSKNVSLYGSTIENTGESPVYVRYNDMLPGKLLITDNTFKNNRGNVFVAFKGNSSDRSVVSRNIFDHNHRWALFHTCPGAPDNACSGGQFLLEAGTENLDILENNFINGGIENYCTQLGASGIEFQTGSMRGISIFSNKFQNNTGAAIAFNPNMQFISDVSIRDNSFIRNQRGDIVFFSGESASRYGVVSSDNCIDETCLTPVISSSYVDVSSQTWNGSLTASNLKTGLYVRLFDRDNTRWGDDIQTYLAEDGSWLSFSFPSKTTPSGCNVDLPCVVRAQLYDPVTGFVSNKIDVRLPASHQSATPDATARFIYELSDDTPKIHTPYYSKEYNAVSYQSSSFSIAPNIYIHKFSELWKGDLASSLAVDKSWFSFVLPDASSTLSSCSGDSCGLNVRAIDLSTCRYSNFSPLYLPLSRPKPEISAIYLNQGYSPWAVGIAGNNLQQAKSVVLLDQGDEWREVPVTSYPNVTFSMPANSPPSACNTNSSCKIQVMIKDSYGQLSKPFVLDLPSIQPAPVLQSASVNTSYSPWAVGVSGTSLSNDLKARLLDGSQQWGGLIQTFLSGDGTFVSFSLPSNTPPSNCNLTSPCSIRVQLVTINGTETNSISLELPKR